MSSRPQVTVVMPTLDRPGQLLVAVASVLAQRDVDLEVVVIDDGSTQPAQQVLSAVEDPRLQVIRHERRRGMSAARNAGMRLRRGEWIAFCDDDDLWAPDKLHTQLAAAAATGRDWVYAGIVHVDQSLCVVDTPALPDPVQLLAQLPRWDTVPAGASNVIVRAALFEQLGGFDERYRHMADWDLWLRLAATGPPACAPRPLVAYRLHSGAMSQDAGGLFAEIDLLEEHGGAKVDRAAFMRWLALRQLDTGHRWAAASWLLRAAWTGRGRGVAGDLRTVAARVRDHTRQPPAVARDADAWISAYRDEETTCPPR